jgi:hypothetical protein
MEEDVKKEEWSDVGEEQSDGFNVGKNLIGDSFNS